MAHAVSHSCKMSKLAPMAGPELLTKRWWQVIHAAVLTCLILYLAGIFGRAISPIKTIISITFDDGYADQYLAASILRLHGMQGTFYIITGKIGQAGYLSWQQLTDMQSTGSEIGGHSITHPNLTSLHGYALRHEICDGRIDLIEHGLRVTSFAYPYGMQNEETIQAVAACGYNSGRGVNGQRETIPPKNLYALRIADPVQNTTTQTALRGYVKQAERAGGGWVQLLIHHVCENCDPYSITPAEFSKFLDWLRQREPDGTVVRTIDQVIGGAVQQPVPAESEAQP